MSDLSTSTSPKVRNVIIRKKKKQPPHPTEDYTIVLDGLDNQTDSDSITDNGILTPKIESISNFLIQQKSTMKPHLTSSFNQFSSMYSHRRIIKENLVTLDQFMKKQPNTSPQLSTMTVYCDGSTIRNGRKDAAGGIGIYFGPNDPRNVSEPYVLDCPTNQRAELYAMYRTLQIVVPWVEKQRSHGCEPTCHIYTDSEYVIKCLDQWIPKWISHNWRKSDGGKIKNQALMQSLASIYQRHQRAFHLHHVRSHTGKQTIDCLGNDQADHLARQGTQQHPNYISGKN